MPRLEAIGQSEYEELKKIFKNLRTYAFDVAKIYFGVQHGDYLEYGNEEYGANETALDSLNRLCELNDEFSYVATANGGMPKQSSGIAVFFNPKTVSRKLLSDFIGECRKGWNPFEYESVYNVGKFFGFPECCIKAWYQHTSYETVNRVFPVERYRNQVIIPRDAIWRNFLKKNTYMKMLRKNKKKFPDKFIEHAPCSVYCYETAKIAERYLSIKEFVDSIFRKSGRQEPVYRVI